MKLGELLNEFLSLSGANVAYIVDGEMLAGTDINEKTTVRDLFFGDWVDFIVAGTLAAEHYIKPEVLKKEVLGFYAIEKDKIVVEVDDGGIE